MELHLFFHCHSLSATHIFLLSFLMAQWNTCRTFKWWFLPQKRNKKTFSGWISCLPFSPIWNRSHRWKPNKTMMEYIQTTIKDHRQRLYSNHHQRPPSQRQTFIKTGSWEKTFSIKVCFAPLWNLKLVTIRRWSQIQLFSFLKCWIFVHFSCLFFSSNKTSSASAPLWNWKQAGDDHSFNNELTKRGNYN